MLLLPLGLSVYALGLGAASRYFFGKYLVYGHHPGILYLAGLVLSLCLCPWGAQTVYARFWSVLASFFTALTATLTAFLYLVMKRNYERYWFLVIVLAVCVGVPLLALAVTSPVLLF
ncbi:MAG: hypothetical protein KIS61_33280, partial [Candidatus Eremiobacteraeota bacterium]|nr:hypothetical protein [Candidatus Eremiobacteraeota bacterium]